VTLTNRPQSREILCKRIGCSDRVLRRAVRELRLSGVPVCSSSQTKGYWLGNDDEAKHLARDYRSRGLKCLEAARKIEATRAKGGQIVWEDILHG
jgi:biotin operon repressor